MFSCLFTPDKKPEELNHKVNSKTSLVEYEAVPKLHTGASTLSVKFMVGGIILVIII